MIGREERGWRALQLSLLLFSLLAQGCVSAPTRPAIGVLLVSGPNVFLNGARAANGTPLANDDIIVTGTDSSAMLSFYSGGSVQLDANTDPQITTKADSSFWARLSQFAAQTVHCTKLLIVGTGQVLAKGDDVCISDGIDQLVPHSEFNLLVQPGREVLTVAEGNVTFAGVEKTDVPGGGQITISGGRIISRRTLNPYELQQTLAWHERYFFQAPPQPPWPCPLGTIAFGGGCVRPPPPCYPGLPGCETPPQPPCAPGDLRFEGRCVARHQPRQCPEGTVAVGDQCVRQPTRQLSCPKGQRLLENQCVPQQR